MKVKFKMLTQFVSNESDSWNVQAHHSTRNVGKLKKSNSLIFVEYNVL